MFIGINDTLNENLFTSTPLPTTNATNATNATEPLFTSKDGLYFISTQPSDLFSSNHTKPSRYIIAEQNKTTTNLATETNIKPTIKLDNDPKLENEELNFSLSTITAIPTSSSNAYVDTNDQDISVNTSASEIDTDTSIKPSISDSEDLEVNLDRAFTGNLLEMPSTTTINPTNIFNVFNSTSVSTSTFVVSTVTTTSMINTSTNSQTPIIALSSKPVLVGNDKTVNADSNHISLESKQLSRESSDLELSNRTSFYDLRIPRFNASALGNRLSRLFGFSRAQTNESSSPAPIYVPSSTTTEYPPKVDQKESKEQLHYKPQFMYHEEFIRFLNNHYYNSQYFLETGNFDTSLKLSQNASSL